MNKSAELLATMYDTVFIVVLIILTFMVCLSFYFAIKGPKIGDRLVSINMMSTLIIVIMAILALFKSEVYIIDICLIYAMISFLAVIVLSKVYLGVFISKQQKQQKEEDNNV